MFTKNPYRVIRFNDLFKKIGTQVDNPESLAAIIASQQGNYSLYTAPVVINKEQFKSRTLGKQPRFIASGIFKEPDRFLYSLSDAAVLGQSGVVYLPEKRSIIDESASDWTVPLQNTAFSNAVKLPEKKHLAGLTLSFLTLGADGGFYHFLFESIIKTAMFADLMGSAKQLLFNAPALDWKLKWLDKAGIDTSKIIWVESCSHFQCEQLLFTSKLVFDQQVSRWCVDQLKEIFAIKNGEQAANDRHLIWASRRGAYTRNIEWEEVLLKRFPELEPVDFTSLSADETIRKMQQATHIIAPHGAGLSNIYLCRPGTKIFELFPNESYFQPCYSRLSSACELIHQVAYLDFKNQQAANGIEFLTEALNEFIC